MNASGLLPGGRVVLVRIERDIRNTDAAFTSPSNLLAPIADSSFLSTKQTDYSHD